MLAAGGSRLARPVDHRLLMSARTRFDCPVDVAALWPASLVRLRPERPRAPTRRTLAGVPRETASTPLETHSQVSIGVSAGRHATVKT